MECLAKCYCFENQVDVLDGMLSRRLQLVVLGSTNGSSSMAMLQFVVNSLKQSGGDMPVPMHVTFKEHPRSNENKLRSTLGKYGN
eukprot:3815075-Ditylum_brightwellii.AAC.1